MLQRVKQCLDIVDPVWHEDERDDREIQDRDRARDARLDGQFDHRLGEYHVKIEGTGVATSKGGNPNA